MHTLEVLFVFALLVLFITICIGAIDSWWFKLTGKSFLYDIEYEDWE